MPYEPDAQHLAWLRFAGYVLSGLAFALALARPPFASSLYSGNLIAVAVLGLGLYATSLRNLRHPAFLYLSAGALAVAGLGIRFFVAGRLHLIEEIVRTALHYPDHLPWPFRAIPALVASTALASLSIWITRNWNDRGLARHCHYLGVPLSIAACLASRFEPVAALICLSGYSILYLFAVWAFAAPWVTYLAIAAMTAAAYFGSTLFSGITLADQALLAAGLGLGFWTIRVLLRRVNLTEDYHLPWLHAALLLTPVALIAATSHVGREGANSFTASGAFVLVGVLAVLLNRERPRTIWAYLALVSFLEFTICGLVLAAGGTTLPAPAFGMLFMFDGLAALAIAEGLHFLAHWAKLQPVTSESNGTVDSRRAGTFLSAIPRFVIAVTLIADWFGVVEIDTRWSSGLVFLAGIGLFRVDDPSFATNRSGLSGPGPVRGGRLVLSYWTSHWSDSGVPLGWLAVTAAAVALTFWGVEVAARRSDLSEFYTLPCLNTSFVLTAGVLALCLRGANTWPVTRIRFAPFALAANTVVTMLLAYTWRRAELTYAAVFHFVVATYLILFSVGQNDPRMAYVLGLVAVIEAIVLWTIGFLCSRVRNVWTNACAWPLDHWAIVLTGVAVLLSDRSPLVLALVAISFLLMVKSRPRVEWLYGTVLALGAACYFAWLSSLSRVGLIESVTTAAFVLWALGILLQRFKSPICNGLSLPPLDYEFPLFHSSIVVGTDRRLSQSRSQFRDGDILGSPVVVSAMSGGSGLVDAQGVSAARVPSPEPGVIDLERRCVDCPDSQLALFLESGGDDLGVWHFSSSSVWCGRSSRRSVNVWAWLMWGTRRSFVAGRRLCSVSLRSWRSRLCSWRWARRSFWNVRPDWAFCPSTGGPWWRRSGFLAQSWWRRVPTRTAGSLTSPNNWSLHFMR